MSKYALAILICGFFIALLDGKALFSPRVETKKFLVSLSKILLLFAIFIITIWKEDDETADKKKIASNYVDSLKKFSNVHADSLRVYGKAYSDSLKHFSKTNSDSLENYSANLIKLLGNYHLQYDSATKSIKDKIDTTRMRQEPFLTNSPNGGGLLHRQSHDTCFFYPSIYNSGNSTALDVSY